MKVLESSGVVNVWGSGEEERDLLYVDDLLTCIESVIQKQDDYYCLINVGAGVPISIANLVQKIIKLSGKKLSIKYDETQPTIKTKLSVDIDRARNLFEWRPKVTIEEGIKKTLTWYSNAVKGL